jgi:hypothetical protein
MDEVVDQNDEERAADTYHSFAGAEIIIPDASSKMTHFTYPMNKTLLRKLSEIVMN